MAPRACPNPVQAVARAARLQTARNALVAAGAVLAAAFCATVTIIMPLGQHSTASCSSDRALVAVHPFALPLDATGRWMPTSGGAGPTRAPVVTGCLDTADLMPADPMRTDGRG